jgi:hypothetical protein
MTLTRAAIYIGIASVVGVWLSSVASSMPRGLRDTGPLVEGVSEPAGLAADVQEQGRRLRQRLASGPPAPRPLRNPFEFHEPRPAARQASVPRSIDGPGLAQLPRADEELALIGVASHQRPDGPVHTAMMATLDGNLIMAVAGDVVLGRFTVAAVDADSADLVDPASGASVRLRLAAQ